MLLKLFMTASDSLLGLLAEGLLFWHLFNVMTFLPAKMARLKDWVIHAWTFIALILSLHAQLLRDVTTFWCVDNCQLLGIFVSSDVIYTTINMIDICQKKKLYKYIYTYKQMMLLF